MRDVILAAAGAAADAAVAPASEPAQPADAGETAALREAAARTAGEAEGLKQGSASERGRIKSIITSDQAKGLKELAHYFAFETELSADMVLSALAKSPAAKTTLDNAMAREAQPKLGAGGERGVYRAAPHDQHRRGLCPPPRGGRGRLATLTSPPCQ